MILPLFVIVIGWGRWEDSFCCATREIKVLWKGRHNSYAELTYFLRFDFALHSL